MSPVETAFFNRLKRRATEMTPELARRWLEAYRLIRESLTERELVDAIRRGHVEQLIAEVASDRALDPTMLRLRVALDQAILEAARAEARVLPSWIKPPAFDVLNPRVVEAARTYDVQVVNAVKAEVRETIREAVVQGIERGVNPRRVAREVVEFVGLSPDQAQAVRNFRAQLEASDRAALRRALGKGVITRPDGSTIVRRAHAGGQGLSARDLALLDRVLGEGELTPEQIDRMVEAYRKRLEAWNAESWARTSALQSQKLGQRQSWEDAIARGVVRRSDLWRRWLAVGGPEGDGRNRPEHLALHGETVGFDEPFSNGQLVPGEDEFNCRCLARIFVARRAAA